MRSVICVKKDGGNTLHVIMKNAGNGVLSYSRNNHCHT